jgi:hypothetical protein
MELFLKLFGDLLVFIYHCFDRIVIHGYLSGLSRPEQVVHFFHRVVGVPVITKEVMSRRTADYQNWVEAFARNHDIPIEWAEKGVRKEDYVQPWLRKMVKKNAYGAFFSFSRVWSRGRVSGSRYRSSRPRIPITASWPARRAASPTTTSTSARRSWGRWSGGYNAFLAVDDIAALQAAADKLSPAIIRKRLDYWTFVLGPKFSEKERKKINLSRF